MKSKNKRRSEDIKMKAEVILKPKPMSELDEQQLLNAPSMVRKAEEAKEFFKKAKLPDKKQKSATISAESDVPPKSKRMSKKKMEEIANSPAMKRKHDEAKAFFKKVKFPDSFLALHRTSPFEFKKPVTGRQYLNRKVELQEIMTKLKGPALVFTGDYKGFGKTSFALKLSKEMIARNSKYSIAYVNMRGDVLEMEMFDKYGSTINGKDYGFDKKIANRKPLEIESCVKEIHARIKRDGKEKALLILDDLGIISSSTISRQAEELFKVLWENKKWLSICVFLGSPTAEIRIFFERLQTHRPKLFDLGLISFLDDLNVRHWYDYFYPRFKKNKQLIDKLAISYMMTKMNNVPRGMQHLAHHLYAWSKPKITKRIIDIAIQAVVDLNRPSYETKFSKLNKLEQAVLLKYAGGKPVKIPVHCAGRTWDKLEGIITVWSWGPFFLDPFFEHYLKDKQNE